MNHGKVVHTSEGPVTVNEPSKKVLYFIIGTALLVVGAVTYLGLFVF